jgi:3-polyprenyl-4-hydroxybenzoate decarboxylase
VPVSDFGWSPDSRQIFFISSYEAPERNDSAVSRGTKSPPSAIYTFDLSTGAQRRLTGFGKNCSASWAPDGTRLAISFGSDQDSGIYCARARKRGVTKVECAIAIGFDPLLHLASVMKMPVVGRDAEFRFVGGLMKRPVPLAKCLTVDIDVPASSEIVFEGFIDLNDVRDEGPYGSVHGYTKPSLQPVMKVKAITHRKDPILTAIVDGTEVNDTEVIISTLESARLWKELSTTFQFPALYLSLSTGLAEKQAVIN